MAAAVSTEHAALGQCWGAGAARCFTIEGNLLDEDTGLRLQRTPDSFICPISTSIMDNPVATADGNVYQREYIEQWIRTCRQRRQPITSPATGLPLASTYLVPLEALRRAIETYMCMRPELKSEQVAKRSFQEAASILQGELLEKQAVASSIGDELKRLRSKLEASEAEREKLEVEVIKGRSFQEKLQEELTSCQAEVAVLKTSLFTEQLEHRATKQKLTHADCSLAAASGSPTKRKRSMTQQQDCLSMSDFLEMAAYTKVRLPHLAPKPQPLPMLTCSPWWHKNDVQAALDSALTLSQSILENERLRMISSATVSYAGAFVESRLVRSTSSGVASMIHSATPAVSSLLKSSPVRRVSSITASTVSTVAGHERVQNAVGVAIDTTGAVLTSQPVKSAATFGWNTTLAVAGGLARWAKCAKRVAFPEKTLEEMEHDLNVLQEVIDAKLTQLQVDQSQLAREEEGARAAARAALARLRENQRTQEELRMQLSKRKRQLLKRKVKADGMEFGDDESNLGPSDTGSCVS